MKLCRKKFSNLNLSVRHIFLFSFKLPDQLELLSALSHYSLYTGKIMP